MATKNEIIQKSSEVAYSWIKTRSQSINKKSYKTMSVNPMMAPMIKGIHGFTTDKQLFEFLMISHHMTGHNTSFGKMIDEKLLPAVFSTIKLDKKFRKDNPPFNKSCFDEIDHLVSLYGKNYLISQKTSKWGIQLTGAVKMNHAFNDILTKYPDTIDGIIVGVTYGDPEDLTDKYDIIRGINTGENHDVHDLTSKVTVLTGKEYWKWLNGGEEETYGCVMTGFIDAAISYVNDKNL